MKTRRIGSLEVSVVGLGTNNFGTDFFGPCCDQADATRVVNAALDAGVTFIDTAEEYSSHTKNGTGQSEQFIRVALGNRRNEAIIATKYSPSHLEFPEERGRHRIVRALEGSLRRLGTDHIDLYQQHVFDADTPIEETLEALDRLVRDGKVVHVGCANLSGAQIDDARAVSAERGFASFATAQNGYSLLDPPSDPGLIDACTRHGMKLLPYFPLASGLLTGKYRRGEAPPLGSRLAGSGRFSGVLRTSNLVDERLQKVETLEKFAAERGHTLLELAFSWLACQPVIGSIIAGATRPEQIAANAAAASWELTPEDLAGVARIVGWAP